jgi:hypothetical protein
MKSRLTRTTVGFILVLASALVLFIPKSLATMPLGDGDDDASVGVNLLANPGFEKEMDGWRRNFANRGAVHELDEANARKGERSLRFSSTDLTYRGAVIQVISAVEPGETYQFGFSRKLQGVADRGRAGSHLRIQFKDARGADTAPLQPFARATGTRDWREEHYRITIPPNTERIYFEIMMDQATGITWWDHLYFRHIDASTGEEPLISMNLISNGSFEQVNDERFPTGFNTFIPAGPNQGSVEIGVDETRCKTGERSVRVHGEGARAAIAHSLSIKGGEAYRLEVWYQRSEGIRLQDILMRVMAYRAKPHSQANKVPWQMEWVHEPHESTYDASGDNFMIRPSGGQDGLADWAKMSATFTLPEEVIGLDVHLFNSYGNGAIWFDDLSLGQLHSDARKKLPDTSVTTPSLSTLRKGHPRLLAHGSDFERIKRLIEDDPLVRQWHAALSASADTILREGLPEYVLPDGKRLLATSRKVLERVETLAMIYRIDQNPRHLHRVWQELEAAAAFPDWNPPHFLDTAEMTRAFAIAYDWLYDCWSEDQKQLIRDAILQKGLEPALLYYRGRKPAVWQWSPTWVQNWNFVVNGGITIGALAIAEEEPEVAEEIMREALESVELAVGLFGPDGAWDEGVSYWHYSIRYLIPYFIALETALGTDYGLAQTPGIAEAGFYPIYLTGPRNHVFSFADSGTGLPRAPEMLWLAEEFDQPAFAGWHRQIADTWGSLTNNLLWYKPGLGDDFQFADLPLDKYFRGVEVATFRSAWQDKDAVFVAFKGGAANVNHGHLDLGDFVLDALGVRWADETGADDYNLPGYNNRGSGQRWTYYRTRAEGQNTLVINPGSTPDQDVRAFAPMILQSHLPGEAVGIIDLTSAYPSVTRAWRGVALFDERRQVIIQDEVTAEGPVELWWFMHTKATIHIEGDGKTATLQRDGKQLAARILSPTNASFEAMDAKPLPTSPNPEGQNANVGIRKLAIHLEDVTDTRIVVQLVPLADNQAASLAPDIKPLHVWQETVKASERLWPTLERITFDVNWPSPHGQAVRGVVPIGIKVGVPASAKLEMASVRIDGEPLFSGPAMSEELLLDTYMLTDDTHRLLIEATVDGTLATHALSFRVENWWEITDCMEPPLETSWFGALIRSQTSSESDGWRYTTGVSRTQMGGPDRRIRERDTEEQLTWETPNLRSVRIHVQAPEAAVESVLRLSISQDGEGWNELPYTVQELEHAPEELRELTLVAEVPEDTPAHWCRLTVLPGQFAPDELQIAQAQLTGLHE